MTSRFAHNCLLLGCANYFFSSDVPVVTRTSKQYQYVGARPILDTADLLVLFIGALSGVLSSIAAWWVTKSFFSPKIEFSQEVSKRPSNAYKSGYLYRIKFKNLRARRAIDVSVVVRVAIFELGLDKTWNWYDIPTQVESIPIMGKGANRLVALRPHLSERFKEPVFPEWIKEKANSGALSPEDLLKCGKKAHIRAYVAAFDEVSGNRKMFCSGYYRLGDFRQGDFHDLTVATFKRKSTKVR